MKTRQELILDFMLALASGVYGTNNQWVEPEALYADAALYADIYLEKLA
jgi:hypothetical protein